MIRRPRTHRTAELRSVALHRLVGEQLQRDPAILRAARERVAGWVRDGPVDPGYARRWHELLSSTPALIALELAADTEEMRDLRQCTPFAGVVAPAERWRIIREIREGDGHRREAS